MSAKASHSPWRQRILRWSVQLVVVALACELLLRLIGFGPYAPTPFHVQFEPENPYAKHARYGYALEPGTFTNTLREGYTFEATHTLDSVRRTSDLRGADGSRAMLDLYGCSFAYGFGVPDSSTFAWKLNQQGNYAVTNYGVPAWGHAQMYQRFQDNLNRGRKPAMIVLAYAGFQDERGTLRRNWRKSLAPYNAQEGMDTIPFPIICTDEGEPEIEFETADYQPWPGQSSSALMHGLEEVWNYTEAAFYDSHEVSQNTIRQMDARCKAEDIRFVVVGMDDNTYTESMMRYCDQNSIEFLWIGVKVMDEQWNLQPYDHHPNAKAHTAYAQHMGKL